MRFSIVTAWSATVGRAAVPRIKLERELSSTSFRFAYFMAHRINRVVGFAWRLHLQALLTRFAC